MSQVVSSIVRGSEVPRFVVDIDETFGKINPVTIPSLYNDDDGIISMTDLISNNTVKGKVRRSKNDRSPKRSIPPSPQVDEESISKQEPSSALSKKIAPYRPVLTQTKRTLN